MCFEARQMIQLFRTLIKSRWYPPWNTPQEVLSVYVAPCLGNRGHVSRTLTVCLYVALVGRGTGTSPFSTPSLYELLERSRESGGKEVNTI